MGFLGVLSWIAQDTNCSVHIVAQVTYRGILYRHTMYRLGLHVVALFTLVSVYSRQWHSSRQLSISPHLSRYRYYACHWSTGDQMKWYLHC